MQESLSKYLIIKEFGYNINGIGGGLFWYEMLENIIFLIQKFSTRFFQLNLFWVFCISTKYPAICKECKGLFLGSAAFKAIYLAKADMRKVLKLHPLISLFLKHTPTTKISVKKQKWFRTIWNAKQLGYKTTTATIMMMLTSITQR